MEKLPKRIRAKGPLRALACITRAEKPAFGYLTKNIWYAVPEVAFLEDTPTISSL